MNIINLVKIAYQALLRNTTRALLTMLGIIIGISSVIAMVNLGQSSQQSISDNISSMGTNLIMVMRARNAKAGGGVNMGASNVQSLTVKDVEAIKKYAKYVSAVSPSVTASAQIVKGANNMPGTLQGGSPEFLEIKKYELESGTSVNFTEEDVKTYSKVCLIGQTVAKTLFPNEDPIGQEIRFGSKSLKVIGILKSKGQDNRGQDQDDIVIAPYSTVQKRILAQNHLQMIYASAKSEDVADLATQEIERIIRSQHDLQPDQSNDFEVRTQAEMLEMMSSVTETMTSLLTATAIISLIVGGIGIMNIMLVTVTERTREIGIRKAVGASRSTILTQFLMEAVVLCMLGCGLGIFLSWVILQVVTTVVSSLAMTFALDGKVVLIAVMFCFFIGVVFGLYPANKAAKMKPIDALHYGG